jgi:hypothetical protein
MPTYIKTGFWEKAKKGYKEWLNLDQFVESKIPTPTYKVYTALLTQSGGDDGAILENTHLTIGVTYNIKDNLGISGWDFTNVGAPNNNIDTSFVATGTTPADWTNGSLFYNTGAPVVTVLENTIGNVWFTYQSDGNYSVNSDNLFTSQKNWCIQAIVVDGHTDYTGQMINSDESTFYVITTEGTAFVNDILTDTPIEIRVYS